MELFLLSESLKNQGFKLNRSQTRNLSEVLVFKDDALYVSTLKDPYYHKMLLKQIRKDQVQERSFDDLGDSYCYYKGLRPHEIVKTDYNWDLDIILITRFQTITEILNPEIRFYRSLHEDAHPRLKVHSLWLAIPEVRERLDPFLFPAQGTTTFIKTNGSNSNFLPPQLIGDDNLSLAYEETGGWRKSD
jgi:hypothetical protein